MNLQVNFRVVQGARGASSPDGASRGPSGAKPCKLQGFGPLMAPLHTVLRPLERAQLLQNMLHMIIFIILAIILVALKACMVARQTEMFHPIQVKFDFKKVNIPQCDGRLARPRPVQC